MATAAIKQTLMSYIDKISDDDINAIIPLLSLLARQENSKSNTDYVVESDLTLEEAESLDSCILEYKKHPENFEEYKMHN